MATKVLRVGIGGYGRSGCDIHAKRLRQMTDRFAIVAVADQLPDRRKDAERDIGCATFSDYRDLLKNADIDLFVNATPSHLHSRGAIDGLRAGFHVVCEKPAAPTVAEFDKMVAASKKSRRRLFPFQNSRYYPFFRKTREVIDSGVLGEILCIRMVWGGFGRRWDWQTLQKFNGGNLMNTGPHPLDQSIVLFGDQMPKVFCQQRAVQPFGGDADDFTALTLYGKDAPMIEILLNSYLAYGYGDLINVSGTFGGLAGGPNALRWKYFDPKKAPKQKLWKPWSLNRGYCAEQLPWVEKTWEANGEEKDAFNHNSNKFYLDVHAALTAKKEPEIQLAQVRRQIAVLEECRRQSKLPRKVK